MGMTNVMIQYKNDDEIHLHTFNKLPYFVVNTFGRNNTVKVKVYFRNTPKVRRNIFSKFCSSRNPARLRRGT